MDSAPTLQNAFIFIAGSVAQNRLRLRATGEWPHASIQFDRLVVHPLGVLLFRSIIGELLYAQFPF
jgi:hypothetical protein